MLAAVAAIIFLIDLILELTGLSLGVLNSGVLLTAGLLFMALYLAGFGDRNVRLGRR